MNTDISEKKEREIQELFIQTIMTKMRSTFIPKLVRVGNENYCSMVMENREQ